MTTTMMLCPKLHNVQPNVHMYVDVCARACPHYQKPLAHSSGPDAARQARGHSACAAVGGSSPLSLSWEHRV